MAKIFIYDFWNVTILELSKLRHLSDLWMDGWMQVFHQGLFFKCTFCKGEMLFLAWCAAFNPLCHLTLSWRRPLYRNQSIDLWSKSVDWFLYDNGLRHERVNLPRRDDISKIIIWNNFDLMQFYDELFIIDSLSKYVIIHFTNKIDQIEIV